MQRRILSILVGIAFTGVLAATGAWAGSPHFVGTPTATCEDSTLTVVGKEAGLGDETQINVTVTSTVLCINNGGNHPKAENKGAFSAGGQFPVQNGKADFTVNLVVTLQPDCSPPMVLAFTNIIVTDAANGLTANLGSCTP
jgi:hypothetical protein